MTREVGVQVRRAAVAGLAVLLAATGVGIGYATGASPLADASSTAQTAQTGEISRAAATRPNIVVVLVDDMSANLLPYMTHATALADSSVQFDSYVVSNPQCCPSRATLLTGKYPHNSLVRSNWWPDGGIGQFVANDLETSLGSYLDDAGYRTALMGKFMNEYVPGGDQDGTGSPDYPPAYVPPGWDEWFVGGNGYGHFAYDIVAGRGGESEIVEFDGDDEANYLTDVLAAEAEDFISRASAGNEPFFLMVAPFAVHSAPKGSDPQAPEGYRFPCCAARP